MLTPEAEAGLDAEPDSQVVRLMQHGHRPAVAVFYRRYLGIAWRFVRSRLAWEADARDVVAETFLAAIGAILRADPAAPVAPWLIGIARNKLADHHRRHRRQRAGLRALAQRGGRSGETASASLESAERGEQVRRALAGMDDEERSVLEWKYVENLSVREIAQRLSRSEKAVESVLYRARNALRELIDPTAIKQEEVER